MSSVPRFIFATCQQGAEAALKQEVARSDPELRFAFSRPGFVTFRAPDEPAAEGAAGALTEKSAGEPSSGHQFAMAALPGPWTFARTLGWSLGKAAGASDEERMADVVRVWKEAGCSALHLFPRDRFTAGHRGYTPGPSPWSERIEPLVRAAIGLPPRGDPACKETIPGERVLDCVLVEEEQWWLGTHVARDRPSCWPGGFYPYNLPEEAVSRAWLKIEEALSWSGLPVQPGDVCVEIGCAPGGSSQALLARGLKVLGVDPAEVAPMLQENPDFTWIRKRGHEVRIRELRSVRWLTADLNVAPSYTLDTVERIVTHDETRVQGLLLTLKLPSWELAAELPDWLSRIRAWGYPRVAARQLHHNRMEVCVAAQRMRSRTRARRR